MADVLDLTGRRALVTGGSRGIGRAIALALAAHGADVAIVYAGRHDAAEATADEARALGVRAAAHRCDVADWNESKTTAEAVVSELGGLDILVNNAGITRDNLLLRMTEPEVDDVLSVDLKGAISMTRHLARALMASPHGRVMNVSSVVGLMGNTGQANYAAAKAGLIGFTKSVARELAGRGVTCNAIAPGFIATDMTAALSDAATEKLLAQVPLKRAGTPDDVASAAVFLASDMGAYITGQVLQVDGGMRL